MSSEKTDSGDKSIVEETAFAGNGLKDVRWYRRKDGIDLAVLARRTDAEVEKGVTAGEGTPRAAVLGVYCRILGSDMLLEPDASDSQEVDGEFGRTGHGSFVVVDNGSGRDEKGTDFERMVKDLAVLCKAIGGTTWEGSGVPGLVQMEEGGGRLKLMHRFFTVSFSL